MSRNSIFRIITAVGLIATIFIICDIIFSLVSSYVVTWDEGWNLHVAKNLVEHGKFIRLRNGAEVTASLHNGPITVFGIAAGLKLAGMEVFAGRLASVTYTILTLVIGGVIAYSLSGRRALILFPFILMIFSVEPRSSFIFVGPQANAESQLVFYTMLGLLFFCRVLKCDRFPAFSFLLCSISFSLALCSKPQLLPFLAGTFIFICLLSLYLKSRQHALRTFYTLIFTYGIFYLFRHLFAYCQLLLTPDQLPADVPLVGMYELLALVTDWKIRKNVILYVLYDQCLFLIGLIGSLIYFVENLRVSRELTQRTNRQIGNVLIFSFMLALTGSWILWFLSLSIGWSRYIVLPIFLGTVLFTCFISRLFEPLEDSTVEKEKGFLLRVPIYQFSSLFYCTFSFNFSLSVLSEY